MTEYRLHYKVIDQDTNESINDLNNYIDMLCEASAKFIHFLMKNWSIERNDPFLFGINRMIDEEEFLCQTEASHELNRRLINQLKKLKSHYEEELNIVSLNKATRSLPQIYELMQCVNEVPMVKVQFDAIKKYRQTLVKSNQYDVRIE